MGGSPMILNVSSKTWAGRPCHAPIDELLSQKPQIRLN